MAEKNQVEETASAPSAKRQIAATVTSTGVAVVLGIVANVLISRVTSEIHNRIAPKTTDNEK